MKALSLNSKEKHQIKNFLQNTTFKSILLVGLKRILLKKSLLLKILWIQLRKKPKNALRFLTNSQNIETLSHVSTRDTYWRITKMSLKNSKMPRKIHAKPSFLSSNRFSFTWTKSIPESLNATLSVHFLPVKIQKISLWIQL